MNRLLGSAALVALLTLGAVGDAVGLASVGVTLTSSGPNPTEVSVNWGDTVTYSNSDSIDHVVRIPRVDFTSPTIPPGGTFAYAFTGRSGTYPFVQQGGRNYSGRVRVSADGSVTIKAGTEIVPYGASVTFSGRSTFPDSPVLVLGRDAGAGGALKPVLELNAGRDGSYTGRVKPLRGGRYQARVAAGQIASDTVSILVRPRVKARVPRRTGVEGTRITVIATVTPSQSADRVELAAYDPRRKRWIINDARQVPRSGRVVLRHELEAGPQRIRVLVRRTNSGFAGADSGIIRVVGTKKN